MYDKKDVIYRILLEEIFKCNISPSALAKKIGIAPTTMYNKLRGHSEWNLAEMVKLQEFVNITLKKHWTLDELFEINDNKTEADSSNT